MDIVKAALATPARPVLLDTASMYENEAAIGAALRELGTPRDDVFIVTKIAHFNTEGDPPHTSCKLRVCLSASDWCLTRAHACVRVFVCMPGWI